MDEQAPDKSASVPVDESLLLRVTDEIRERLRRGESPDAEQYVAEYPELADVLQDLLPALLVMGGASNSGVEPADIVGFDAPVAGQLGDFQILREIGHGSMGVVYEAKQLSLNRIIALKVLPFASVLDPKRLQRFKNEAQAAGQLHHPHIVPVYAVGSDRGVHYYAMQLIEGLSLAEVITDLRGSEVRDGTEETVTLDSPSGSTDRPQSGPRPRLDRIPPPLSSTGSPQGRPYYDAMARLGVQAARALDHAHSLGILHRDVKPSNLMVDMSSNVWVSDFGLARIAEGSDLTMTGDIIGTLAYMSPEAARGHSAAVDHRADIYSLGASLYHALTLSHVFSSENRVRLLERIANEEPRPLRHHNQSIPVDLETIILKTLSKDPSERYTTAADLADDLQRYLEEKPITARRPSLADRAVKWTRRHRTLVAATFVVLLLSTIGFGVTTLLVTRAQSKTAAALVAVTEARDEAERNLRLAEEAAARERQMAQWARKAADSMYLQFADEWLADQPRLTQVEKQFLEEALDFYQNMVQLQADNYENRLGKAVATMRLGSIHYKLGQMANAEQHLNGAIDQLSTLEREKPNDPQLSAALAESHDVLGRILADTGDLNKASERLKEATGIWRDVPIRADSQCKQVAALIDLGVVQNRMHRFDEAEKHLLVAIDHIQNMKRPDDANARYLAVKAHHNLAAVAGNRGIPKQVLERLKPASSHLEALLTANPRHRGYRESQRFRHMTAAMASISIGQFKEAEADCLRALKVSEDLAKDFPEIPEYRQFHAQDLANLVETQIRLGRNHVSIESAQAAAQILDDLCNEHADVATFQSDRAYVESLLGRVATSLEQHPAAVHHYERALGWQELLYSRSRLQKDIREELANILASYAWFRGFCPDPSIAESNMAIDLAKRALELNPEHPVALTVLAACLFEAGAWEAAEDAAERAIKIDGGHTVIARLYFAMALARRNDKRGAQDQLRRAREAYKATGVADAYGDALLREAESLIDDARQQGNAN